MTFDLPEGVFASVNPHSGRIWLSIHSGGSAVLPLTPEQAKDIGLALWRAGREASRPKP